MDIELDQPFGDYQIKAYEPGKITINDKIYERTVILSLREFITDCPIQHFAEINEGLVQQLIDLKPDIILIGTGTETQFLPAPLQYMIQQQNIGIETMPTASACRTFNVLTSEKREVVALLLV